METLIVVATPRGFGPYFQRQNFTLKIIGQKTLAVVTKIVSLEKMETFIGKSPFLATSELKTHWAAT